MSLRATDADDSASVRTRTAPESIRNHLRHQEEQQWPWETDEAKRYPGRDPTRMSEFERRYPPDQVGQELGSNARVFRVYQERVNELDSDTIAGWNDTINFLLIFAGLFSAVLTAFLLELSKKLEPDYTEYSSMSLLVIASVSSGSNKTAPVSMDPRSFQPKAKDRAINALWFASLTLALVVSMLSILTKQWMGMFVSRMRMPVRDFRRWAHRHRAYRDSVDRWHLNTFVSCLSVALHVALLLFLLGLIIHTYALDLVSFVAVSGLSAFAFLFYLATTIAPLYDQTCPTATPLLDHGRSIFSWIFGRWSSRNGSTVPPFAHQSSAPGDPGVADVKILTWMLNSLAGEHDVDATLDAAAQLPADRTRALLAAANHAPQLSSIRLQRLVDSKPSDEHGRDPAEVARALRSSLRLEDGTNQQTLVLSSQLSANIRTHDVGVLVGALGIHFASLASPDPLDWAATLARFHVDSFCAALGSWSRHLGRDPTCPVTTHTRRILYQSLLGAAKQTQDLISIEHCAWLVLVFGREEDAADWTELLMVFLNHAIRNSIHGNTWSPLSNHANSELRVMHAWAWVFTRMSVEPDPETFGSLGRDDAWRCYLLHAEGWPALTGEAVPSLSRLQSTLAPFNSEMIDTAAATSGAFRLLRLAMRDRNAVQRGWNSSIAQIVFSVFDRSRRHRGRHPAISGTGIFEFLTTLLSHRRQHEDITNSLLAHGTPHDLVQQSMLNLLVPRTARDTSYSSVWRLAVESLAEPNYLRALASHVAALSTQLAIVAILDPTLPIADFFEQLLGGEYGSCLLLAADPSDTFDIVRHVAISAPQWWAVRRVQLIASRWNQPGHSWNTPAQLVVDAESAPLCAECAAIVERARYLIDQPLEERQETSYKEIKMWFDEHDVEHRAMTMSR